MIMFHQILYELVNMLFPIKLSAIIVNISLVFLKLQPPYIIK
jgi:hypothetical protein